MKPPNHRSIKSWHPADRPREKLTRLGSAHLSDAELLAILIRSGSAHQSALELSRSILSWVDHDLHRLARKTVAELQQFSGIGHTKATSIKAALELAYRRQQYPQEQTPQITSSAAAYQFLASRLTDLSHEEFWVIYLSRANHVVEVRCISKGGISATLVDIRLILKQALEFLATGLILAHNHPSGQLKPSKPDLDLTQKICDGARFMDIAVLDHIIVGMGTFFSFADEGLLA